jgi:hypothetical protein
MQAKDARNWKRIAVDEALPIARHLWENYSSGIDNDFESAVSHPLEIKG